MCLGVGKVGFKLFVFCYGFLGFMCLGRRCGVLRVYVPWIEVEFSFMDDLSLGFSGRLM